MKIAASFALLIFAAVSVGQVTIGGGATLGAGVTVSASGSSVPTISPTAGTYSSPQTVTIACPGSLTAFYTTDGSEPDITSTRYTGPFTVSASSTVRAVCATASVSYANIQDASTGWSCVTPNAQTYGSLSCEAGLGVGSNQPSSLTMTWGSTMNVTLGTTASTGQTQALYVYKGGGCDQCSELVQNKWVEPSVNKPNIAADEMDVFQMDGSRAIEHMGGLQCNNAATTPQWQIADATDPWVNTGITADCPLPTGSYTHIVSRVHWINGDTGCGGYGCIYYDWVKINGVKYPINLTQPARTIGWSSMVGVQDQIDLTNTATTGQNPTNGARNIQNESVAAGMNNETAVSSATYVITPSQAAGYNLVWQDNFNPLTLSTTNTAGSNWYNPSQYTLPADGVITNPTGYVNLNLQLTQGSDVTMIGTACMNGACGRSWTPPFYIEVSAAFPPIIGSWPGIWMEPITYNQAQAAPGATNPLSNNVPYGEIDLFEWQSNTPTTGYGTVHVWENGASKGDNSASNTWTIPSSASLANYNTYGVLVTDSAVSWYFNNNLLFTFATTAAPFNTVFAGQESYYLMLDQQAGCNWAYGTCSGMTGPFNMQVQWVHVFQP